MTQQQQEPTTEKLEHTPPPTLETETEQQPDTPLLSLENIVLSHNDDSTSHQEEPPLRLIPIMTDDGTFQGYFLPAATETPFPTFDTTVDSTIHDITPTQQSGSSLATQPATLPIFNITMPKKATLATILTVSLTCLLAFSLLATLIYTASFQKTLVSITPQERAYSATIPLHLVTGSPTSLTQVEARRLSPITLSQALSHQATGSYQQQPTYSLGYVDIYNGSFSSITIAARTQFIGSDGVSVVTTKSVTVPGVDQSANPPALGEAAIPAQAQQIGSRGNIAAYDISGTCPQCGASVLVKNPESFTGGQDAKTFVVVKQSDIDSMKSPLTTSLEQSMQSAIQGQARPGEQLLLSPCRLTYQANHHANAIASSVTLTATQTCTGLAYTPAQVQENALQLAKGQRSQRPFFPDTCNGDACCNHPAANTNHHRFYSWCIRLHLYQAGNTTDSKADCGNAGHQGVYALIHIPRRCTCYDHTIFLSFSLAK